MNSPKILAIGGAHVDRRGRMTAPFVPGASIPGSMSEEVGGGAFNALRGAVRRGAAGALMSVRGGDAAGETVASEIVANGIEDLSAIFLDRATPSYTALLDRDGDVVAALADMGLYELAFAKQLRRAKAREAVAAADAVLCDANLPEAALARLGEISGKPLFAIAISPAKAVRLVPVLGKLACLYMNRREAAVLADIAADSTPDAIARGLREAGLRRGVVTAGGSSVFAYDAAGLIEITPPAPRWIVDVTGAGDALAGATTVALMRGLPLEHALREGIAAAVLAIESASAVPELAQADFDAALALVPQAREMA
ncbi:sugar/nucleoside kinase (ribokinase family) [Aminobacter aminovorans]|uniref:Pseudouridine kinase n=1 Tax=Aminobacter aminovorans TaxID=83263 RepID=A0A380WND9_AMIAI|nr:carbohydrate kinase family protein [Aminobacter aminovorans]TCS25977.1 sugar/nucleoside kinase (ribokinase family) [Aminobacter aminovorans]SUU90358.1 Pseudouridine kinase [Aminobacter aminovorans]